VDVAWSNDPLYISETTGGNLTFYNRFETNYEGKYVRRLLFENRFCRREGYYEVRLRGSQKQTIYAYRYNDDMVSPRPTNFDELINWKAWGEKILLLSDPCGDQHTINVTGYYDLKYLDRSRYEYER